MSEIINNHSLLSLVKTDDGFYNIEFKSPELNYFYIYHTCDCKKISCTSIEKIDSDWVIQLSNKTV